LSRRGKSYIDRIIDVLESLVYSRAPFPTVQDARKLTAFIDALNDVKIWATCKLCSYVFEALGPRRCTSHAADCIESDVRAASTDIVVSFSSVDRGAGYTKAPSTRLL
jgi:hypothetical protein